MSEKKYGVLLVNLGTPVEPTPAAVRTFLKEFLSDKRVIDAPRIIWLPILYGIILAFRPKKVAVNYQKIWLEGGSPLMVYSLKQQQKLQDYFKAIDSQNHWQIELAMTYGAPSIQAGITKLKKWGADEVVVLPLYPQFSHTTTSAVTDQLANCATLLNKNIRVINDYHDNVHYIKALAETVKAKLLEVGGTAETTKLIMSFHGIPKRYVTQGDPYQSHCQKTAVALAAELALSESEWEMAYQSRVGREEWLRPYLDERMSELPKEGTQQVIVICPGFSSDCLETLEEIAMENKAVFLENGGQSFTYVEALNASQHHIEMMATLIKDELQE